MSQLFKSFLSKLGTVSAALKTEKFAKVANEYKEVDLLYRQSAAVTKSYKTKLNNLTEEMGKFVEGKKGECEGVSLCRVAPTARVDYKAVYAELCRLHPELSDSLDLNNYTSNVSEYWRVTVSA